MGSSLGLRDVGGAMGKLLLHAYLGGRVAGGFFLWGGGVGGVACSVYEAASMFLAYDQHWSC